MLKSKVTLTVVAILISFAAVAKDGVPSIDSRKLCRDRAASTADMMGDKTLQSQAFDSCVRSEQEARDALVAAWKDIPASYKTACIKPKVYSPSYAEWLSCLELNIDVKTARSKK
jgi:hypothetical protein